MSAKQKYDELMKDCEETSPIERLRFYCSLAMNGQDWLDVEPFIDALRAVYECPKCGAEMEISKTAAPASEYFLIAPQSAPAIEAALEEFGMKCIDGVLNLNPHLWTEHNLRAIVNQVMKEMGK